MEPRYSLNATTISEREHWLNRGVPGQQATVADREKDRLFPWIVLQMDWDGVTYGRGSLGIVFALNGQPPAAT